MRLRALTRAHAEGVYHRVLGAFRAGRSRSFMGRVPSSRITPCDSHAPLDAGPVPTLNVVMDTPAHRSLPAVVILGRSAAGRYLMSKDPTKGGGVRHAISIGDFDESPAAGFNNVGSRLRLIFSDVAEIEVGHVLPSE